MIPQRNLSLLSNRLARKGVRRIPEATLERDYCLSWFLIGLSKSSLKDALLFKGGTAIKKCYVPDYRFSEDLDFTLVKGLSFEDIRRDLDVVFEHIQQDSGIKMYFSRQDRHSHQNSYTFYMGYEGPLPGAAAKELKVDITIREHIVFPIEVKAVLKEYDEYADIPADSDVCVYALAEITSEKVVALLDKARNEPRDLYDIWYLISHEYIELSEIVEAVRQKLEFRNKKLTDVQGVFLEKEVRLNKLWEIRLVSQMSALPEFDRVYRKVKREFKRAGLPI